MSPGSVLPDAECQLSNGDHAPSSSGSYVPKNGTHHIKPFPPTPDAWYYPDELRDDLRHVGLPDHVVDEVLACAWEYVRCVIPEFTNWPRYLAFARTIVIGIVAEFSGSLVDIAAGDGDVLGYDLQALLDAIFAGTPGREAMARELITADKCSDRYVPYPTLPPSLNPLRSQCAAF